MVILSSISVDTHWEFINQQFAASYQSIAGILTEQIYHAHTSTHTRH